MISDRALIRAFNASPILLGVSAILLIYSLLTGPGGGYVAGFLVLAIVAGVSQLAARRAGGARAITPWRASDGWERPRFELGFRDDERGRRTLKETTDIALAHGYRTPAKTRAEGGRVWRAFERSGK
ncbi:MAG TPA: hypothetical protein VKR30_01580 [Candidatus Limnocylindrales bacterium]|nr:hypothetical protein [Candidatus Limnocylindrales bacterium]